MYGYLDMAFHYFYIRTRGKSSIMRLYINYQNYWEQSKPRQRLTIRAVMALWNASIDIAGHVGHVRLPGTR